MDNWFNSKWFVRIVSLAFAILIYVLVNVEGSSTQSDGMRVPGLSNAVQTLRDVPVDIKIDGEQYVVSGVPESVIVTLEGPNSVLIPTARQQNFDIFVDLTGLGEGDHTVDIQYERVPNELSIYIEPKTISVTIEERSTEEFPVLIDYINMDQLPDGYELGEVEINPDTVMITSSRKMIEQIAMVKVFIDVAGLTEPINNREVPVNVYDSQGNGLNVRVIPERVVVSVNVDNPSKTVSIKVETEGDLPDGYVLTDISANIEELEVFAVSDILNGIDEILTEPIDLSSITSSRTIDVNLAVPDGAVVKEETITVDIKLEQTKEFEGVPVHIDNVDANRNVEFVNPSDRENIVIVSGPEEIIRDLSVDDIHLSIDVSGLEDGEHTIPVLVEIPDDVSFELDVKEVTITIL